MTASLQGRVALVTGCTGGIGDAVSRALAEAGAAVVGGDVGEGGPAWERAIPGSRYHPLDVTSESDWARVIASIEADHGALDVLVHVAGIDIVEKLETTSLAEWRRQMAVNVDGPFLGTKAATDLMRRTGAERPFGASIIIISSAAGLVGAPLHTGYCASKGAVRMFSKAAAIEFSALGYKIRVNSVHPSGVRTGMVDHIKKRSVEQGFAKSIEAAVASTLAAHPMGRIAEPIEIAKAVRFLASDESSYVHGSELVVDGGYTAK